MAHQMKKWLEFRRPHKTGKNREWPNFIIFWKLTFSSTSCLRPFLLLPFNQILNTICFKISQIFWTFTISVKILAEKYLLLDNDTEIPYSSLFKGLPTTILNNYFEKSISLEKNFHFTVQVFVTFPFVQMFEDFQYVLWE